MYSIQIDNCRIQLRALKFYLYYSIVHLNFKIFIVLKAISFIKFILYLLKMLKYNVNVVIHNQTIYFLNKNSF